MHKYAYRLTKLRKFHDGNKNQQILKQKSGLAGNTIRNKCGLL